MATRARTTFQKRQKEMARKDKQQRKAERREQRTLSRGEDDSVLPQDDTFPPEAEFDIDLAVSRSLNHTVDS